MLTSKSGQSRYFVELAFNGKGFNGWQIQPGKPTIQGCLNQALSTLLNEPVNLTGCGRTDSGVHASHFIAHFETTSPVPDTEKLTMKLRRFINPVIRIDRIVGVSDEVHARFQAISRTYHYLIDTAGSPFYSDFSWKLSLPLDIAAMNAGASLLVGTHDFTSFSKLHTDVKTNICTVSEAEWIRIDGFVVFRIRSDRFLRNMVRAIVGTLVEVGRGKITPAHVIAILESKNRSSAGASVPASGLILTCVQYDLNQFIVRPVSPFPHLISIH